MSQGDFEWLPSSFRKDDGQIASEVHRTVLIAMKVIEGRRVIGVAGASFSMNPTAIQGPP